MHARRRDASALRSRIAIAGLITLLAGACGSPVNTPIPSAATQHPATSPSPTATPSASPGAVAPTPGPSAAASCVQRVLAGMTLDQRIGQLFLLGLANDELGPAELGAIRDQHVGSVWFTTRTTIGVAGVRAVTEEIQAAATADATAGVGFLVAANQEGGLIQALNGPGFSTIPSALVQGGRPVATLTAEARRWGDQLRAAGVNLDFAPVADVVPPGADATNQPIGVLRRELGHDPLTAGRHAAAFVAGMTRARVATTLKHFPGLGRVAANTDFAAGVIDDTTTAGDPYLSSFRAAIRAGAPFVMVALATYTRIDPANLAVFSSIVMKDVLRGDLGFDGVIMSDSLTAAAVKAIPAGQRAIGFLAAGGDLVVVRSVKVAVAMVGAVRARVRSDATFAARVDDAVRRVLVAKQAAGLLPCATG